MSPDTSAPLVGHAFANELLQALGLGHLSGVTGLSVEFNGTFATVTVSQLVRRPEGATLVALLKVRRFTVVSEVEVGQTFIDGAPQDLRLTPIDRRAEG